MRIGLDIMGGDFAPESPVNGAVLARADLPESAQLILYGDNDLIHQELQSCKASADDFSIVHADQTVEMGDHPVRAISQKPRSSMALGFKALANGEIDAFCSAGNTGAMLAGAMFTIKAIPGIIRPAIAAALPRKDGGITLLLDVGLNPDARADVLYQYGIMGSLYVQEVYQIDQPRVGLLNIGSEEDKGSLLSKATYQIMKGTPEFNFIGNVEGNEFFSNKADVVVCDGFTGNVVLKQAESFYYLMKKGNNGDPFLERFNYENFGGTPILGIGSPVLIGHGISSPLAIKNMLIQNKTILESGLIEKIRKAFK